MSPTVTAAPRRSQVYEGIPFHHVVNEERLIKPIFAAERAVFHPTVDRHWRILENAAAGVGSVSPEHVCATAERLIGLLRGRGSDRTGDGLARFRREFCLGQLESIVALRGHPNSDEYVKVLLTGDVSGRSTQVDASIRAGVADYNERFIISLRQRYAAKGGLGERIVAKLTLFQEQVEAAHPGVGFVSGREQGQAKNAQKLLKHFGEVSREIRTFLSVLPEERSLVGACEERLEGIQSRLHTNHFGGVLQIATSIVGDIHEGINLLRILQDARDGRAYDSRGRASRRG